MSTEITKLAEVLEVASGDQIPIASLAEGSPRKVSVNTLTTYILAEMEPLSGLTRQSAAPSASPMTVTVSPPEDGASMRLIIKPTGTMAVGTINLPDVNDAADGQEVLVSCTQVVTALTVAASGLNVTGAPTALAANGFFRMMYDLADTTWYRVG